MIETIAVLFCFAQICILYQNAMILKRMSPETREYINTFSVTLQDVESFLLVKEWKCIKTHRIYRHYKAPGGGNDDFILTIPRMEPDFNDKKRLLSFKKSLKNVVKTLSEMYGQDELLTTIKKERT